MIQEIIEKYKEFMKNNYPNQGAAAKDLGISRSHLNKIINRRDNPSTALLLRMEEVIKNGK